ncbi:MAG: tetratricopeptide repeat protein [Elusimicrobia bacterium]|nr:tetratricopeptide repeat protein [Elusimicrobiota bacterium]
MNIIIVIIVVMIAAVFLVYQFNLQDEKITKVKKIEKMIEMWKNPLISEIGDYEAVINKLTDKTKKAAGLFLVGEFYFYKVNKSEHELKRLRDVYTEIIGKYSNFEKIDDVLFKIANVYFFDYFSFIESIKYYEKLLNEYTNSKWIKVAAERLSLIKSAYPDDESALKKYALAEKYFEVQNFDKTIECLKSILATHPNSKLTGMAYYFLGDIFFFKKSDYTIALNYYSQLVEKLPQHRYVGSAQFKIGETYRKLQKYNEAIIAYKKFLENYNDFQYTDYAQYYIGQCYEDIKDWVLAVRTYKLLVANYLESIWVDIAMSKIKNLEKLIIK